MSLSHHIHGPDSPGLQAIVQAVVHWPWRLWLLLPSAVLLALFAASYPITACWSLLIALCAWFVAGAIDVKDDVRRSGPRGS